MMLAPGMFEYGELAGAHAAVVSDECTGANPSWL